MKRYFLSITAIAFLVLSCSKTKQGDLLEIPIDIHQNNSLPLSEIAEEITAIELELTDESMISPYYESVIISEDEVIFADRSKIFVFSKTGKFIRTIGTIGQGPGEHIGINGIALDKKNKRLIVCSNWKIIFYDLNGKFLKEKLFPDFPAIDINYIDEKPLLLVERQNRDSKGAYSRSIVYQLNEDLQLADSCTIRDLYVEGAGWGYARNYADYILKGNKSVYLYFGDFFTRRDNSAEKVLRDTLYRFENNRLIPELKLKFKNDETGKFIHLYNIYRSSRYIFAAYRRKDNNRGKIYSFCYDTKTGKGYNMPDGYMDEINQIEDPVRIRPFNLDTEMFYYLHTHMKPDDLEEPNPTLYIGKLKK
ncbi:hypothetical protein AGMMS50239_04640 [Bacteroidia bacterium]|nr:hypothetical protein AGMMS50239_04640 [Bacteroidia bacterium]